MNTFGRLFRVHIFGESHGESVGVVIDGCPAGLSVDETLLLPDLERRKGGIQKGTTPRKEEDVPLFKSGIFNGKTTGAPIALFFENKNTRSEDYTTQRNIPRPGHADFVANKKFGGYEDYRGGGHFSARLTTGLVAAGSIAKKIINHCSIEAHVIEIAGESDPDKGLQKAIDAKDSVGGIIECRVNNLPIGLGEPFFHLIGNFLGSAHHIHIGSASATAGDEFAHGWVLLAGIADNAVTNGLQPLNPSAPACPSRI